MAKYYGWISLYRSIQDNWVWKDKPFSKGQAWIDLILLANHEDKKVLLGNTLVQVETGSFITSINKLSTNWGWSRHKTSDFLNLLEKDNMLTQKRDTSKTLITIENYSGYQCEDVSQRTTKGQRKDNKRTTKGQRRDINNNDNNDNNIYIYIGRYKNVKFTKDEFTKLKEEFPNYEDWIEELSSYMASSGKTYKNHLATIRRWASKRAKENASKDARKEQTDGAELKGIVRL